MRTNCARPDPRSQTQTRERRRERELDSRNRCRRARTFRSVLGSRTTWSRRQHHALSCVSCFFSFSHRRFFGLDSVIVAKLKASAASAVTAAVVAAVVVL